MLEALFKEGTLDFFVFFHRYLPFWEEPGRCLLRCKYVSGRGRPPPEFERQPLCYRQVGIGKSWQIPGRACHLEASGRNASGDHIQEGEDAFHAFFHSPASQIAYHLTIFRAAVNQLEQTRFARMSSRRPKPFRPSNTHDPI